MSAVIRGAGGGSSGSTHTPVESPDNLRSIAYFRILDLVSEGEIAGLVNGQQSIFLDQTPLANDDGTSNFPNAHIEERTGTQDQLEIAGFDSVENEISVGVELTSDSPWLLALTDVTLSAVRVTLSVPALSKANTSNGDITGYTIAYKIEISTDGGAFASAYNGSFTGKTTTKFQRSHRLDLPAATTGWQVRVTRLTANAHSSAIADTTTVDSYTEIVDAKLRYPNSALIGVMGDASQFSNIPQRAYDLWGRIVQVPSNYDVTTRAYTGVWDGTFKPSWTDNPAWIFYDLVTHTRYGLGHLVAAAQIDKWALYAIGQYCDGMVDDGNGGTEPRLTCNIYLQTQADAYKLLNDLSSAFRGISYWANGTIVASADMPADPVYTYTDANVIEGKFSYSASARNTRYTTALVSWNDPRNFYLTKVEYVEDRDGIARYGIQQTEVTAVGCASQGQAQRLGRWILLTSRYETDTVTFSVGLDGTLAAPGQIIRIADSARAGRRIGGRVHIADSQMVVLDNGARVIAGATITVNMPDGTSQTRIVQTVETPIDWDSTTVTFDSTVYTFDMTTIGGTGDNMRRIFVTVPFTEAPAAAAVWVVENTDQVAQTFRVLSVTEDKSDADLSFTLTCLQHNASKFDAVDTGTIIQVPPISALTVKYQAAPATVTATYAVVTSQGTAKNMLQASWDAAPLAVQYEVEWRQDNGEWVARGTVYGQTADFGAVHEGDFDIRVRAVNAAGNASLFTQSSTLTISDAGFRLSQNNLSMLRVGGIGSAWTGFAISYVSTPTAATISCTAGTLQDGANNPSYAASSASVSGTAGTTVTYYLYYDDPAGTGGTLSLGVSTTYSDLSANQGRIFVGAADVVYPASGSGGGGGSPGGGGGCVTVDMWLLDDLLAGRVQIGQAIDGAAYDPVGMVDRIVETNLILAQPCMRLITESGCTVDASCSTPMTMPDGSVRMFPDMLGELALVNDHGDIRWERVVDLYPIGVRPVVHIRMNNQCFFAGADASRRIATHNLIMVK